MRYTRAFINGDGKRVCYRCGKAFPLASFPEHEKECLEKQNARKRLQAFVKKEGT